MKASNRPMNLVCVHYREMKPESRVDHDQRLDCLSRRSLAPLAYPGFSSGDVMADGNRIHEAPPPDYL